MTKRRLRSGRQALPPPKSHIELDFIVAERPYYIPGSGPPLAPILAMPAHDKGGYIIKEVELYSELRYLVGYEEQPDLRVSVRLPNILNWVSPRALEQYHSNKVDEREREREEIELPLIEAREERKKKRLEKLSREGVPVDAQSRKRKRTPIDEITFKGKKPATPGSGKKPGRHLGPGSGRRNQQVDEEVSFRSPRHSQRSQGQPSLSASGGALANRTVLDSDSEDEESVVTDAALEYQLKAENVPSSNIQSSRSASESAPVSKRSTRSKSASQPVNTSREESPTVSAPGNNGQRRRSRNLPPSILSGRSAVAATSSREALRVYEDLERKSRKPLTIADKYSFTRKTSQSQNFKGAHFGLTGTSRGLAQVISDDESDESAEEEGEENKQEEAEDESEYEVKHILHDEIRFSKDGKEETWYKIKWVGEWDDTWEPAENVGHGAIKEYENEKRKKKGKGRRSAGGDDSDPDSLFVSDRKGKGKEVKRGEVIDDDDDDEDSEMQDAAYGL